MTDSVCSSMSNVTVSAFGGEEMPLEDAVDQIFKELQRSINELHVQIRNLCMTEERGDTYIEAYEYYHGILSHVDEGQVMFKELKAVMKQILPKRPKGLVKSFEKEYNPDRDYDEDDQSLFPIKE